MVILLFLIFGNHLSFRGQVLFRVLDPMPSLVVAVTTIPVLALIMATQSVSRAALGVGQLSEEIFRGNRLPILTFPLDPNADPE